jgi:hypothetical protein
LNRELTAVEAKAVSRDFPLRPGPLASADILREKRTVFEWVFEPALALRERLRGSNAVVFGSSGSFR